MIDSIYWYTLIKRPYVFAFFIIWAVLAVRHLGKTRAALWLVLGFSIAWISEATSIRTGFPYGWYFYRYENLQNEWLLFGVPVWDSLSYVFLSYAGLTMALGVWSLKTDASPNSVSSSRSIKNVLNLFYSYIGRPHRVAPTKPKTCSVSGIERVKDILALASLTAFFTTLLDVVIDPLAHRGGEWFLGEIYYYPHPGYYFDVPLSNFMGWLLVTFLIPFCFFSITAANRIAHIYDPRALRLGQWLYLSVLLFNMGLTLWIGAYTLFAIDCVILTGILYLLIKVGAFKTQLNQRP